METKKSSIFLGVLSFLVILAIAFLGCLLFGAVAYYIIRLFKEDLVLNHFQIFLLGLALVILAGLFTEGKKK